MEVRWLNDFIALARTRHFSRAADQQNVTQPTFSRRIKLLEEEIGTLLVDRNTLPLSLTPAGRIFLDAAERITALLADTREQCHRVQADDDDRLRIAATQSLYLSLYQTWVQPLASALDISMDHDLESSKWAARDFADALLSGSIDMMLTYWHPDMTLFSDEQSSLLQHLVVGHEQLLLCSATDANGEPRFSASKSMTKLPYIAYDPDSLLEPVIQMTMETLDIGVDLQRIGSEKHCVGVKAMVKGGFGTGWLPGRLAGSSIRHGQLVPLGDLQGRIPLEVRVYRLNSNSHSQLGLLWETLRRKASRRQPETEL